MRLVALGAVLLVTAAGCGSASTPGQSGAAGSLQVLSTSAVPGVASKTVPLTTEELAKDASIPDLAA